MFFDQKRIIKIEECQAISFFAVECLAEVVVEKKINRFTAILSGPFDR